MADLSPALRPAAMAVAAVMVGGLAAAEAAAELSILALRAVMAARIPGLQGATAAAAQLEA